jgi:DNA helicase-2/ATP-dependent DNA helicase PcrA
MALTAQQKDFIKSVRDTEHNLVLMARAGTGKTYTLVKACEAIPSDDKVLALAFNKAIADELQSRLPANAKAQTMNSLGHRAWQRSIGNTRITLDADKVGNLIRLRCKGNPELWEAWSDIRTLISKARLHGLVPTGSPGKYQAMMEDTEANWDALIAEYDLSKCRELNVSLFRELLRESIEMAFAGKIDFDDQIYMTTIWNVRVDKFDVILVDEAQDLSDMQHRFIEKMMDDSTRLIVVGDDKQAIYAFRGSTSGSLQKLATLYDCKAFPLTVSFRCPKKVVEVAKMDVPDFQHHDEAQDGHVERLTKWQAETIEQNSAILCRNVAPLVKCTYRLIAAGRPAIMTGRDIGRGLINLVNTLIKPEKNMRADQFLNLLQDWKDNEINIARAQGKPQKEEAVIDKAESILAVQSYSRAVDTDALCRSIDNLFAVSEKQKIILSTIHRSKGLEWDTVYILDDWRIPSKYAKEAVKKKQKGAEEQMQQEINLRYVAVTRSKNKLFYINTDDYTSKIPEPQDLAIHGDAKEIEKREK